MVSVRSASLYITSLYITSASRYHPHYHSRSSMYIRGLIQRYFADLAEAVLIGLVMRKPDSGLHVLVGSVVALFCLVKDRVNGTLKCIIDNLLYYMLACTIPDCLCS